jgi:hypothetical protein
MERDTAFTQRSEAALLDRGRLASQPSAATRIKPHNPLNRQSVKLGNAKD